MKHTYLLWLLYATQLSAKTMPQNLVVDFVTAMEGHNEQLADLYKTRKENPLFTLCSTLYEHNKKELLLPNKKTIIPKTIHLIWLGPNTPPAIFEECLKSIKEHLPEWNLKIWKDADLSKLDLTYYYYIDEEANYGAKSDILRYELLYKFGGVYLDIDIKLLQPLDILNETFEFYCCMMPLNRIALLNNCIIGSIPGHPILKECLDSLKYHRYAPEVISRTGPVHFQEAFFTAVQELMTHGKTEKIMALPKSFFFPFEENDATILTPDELAGKIKPETMGIHYWAGSWVDTNNHMLHRSYHKKEAATRKKLGTMRK